MKLSPGLYKRFVGQLFILAILGFIAQTVTAAQPKLVQFRSNPVVSQRLQAQLSAIPSDSTVAVWIFFTDKGFADQAGFAKARVRAENVLTTRSKERRANRGQNSLEIQYEDIPVHKEYVQQIHAISGVQNMRTRTRWFNGISVDVLSSAVAQIALLPFVREVRAVNSFRYKRPDEHSNSTQMDAVLPKISAELNYGPSYSQLEQINVVAAHNAGYTGKGILVLMLDTGFYLDHESVSRDRVVAQYDFINKDSVTQNQPGDPAGQDGHGTSTFSALGGAADGKLYGPAYQCDFLLAKTEIENQEIRVEEDYYVAALEWGDSLGADLVSSSLGYLDWYSFKDINGQIAITTKGVNRAIARGITVVTAAGNENGTEWNHIISPADALYVISCGAVNLKDIIASFSSHGPTYDGRIKPEVVARGVATYCASNSGPAAYHNGYGTSLSTPLVGGATALVLQAHPDWSPLQARRALMNTADNAENPDNIYGWGLIDVMAAINYIQPEQQPVSTSQNYPNPFSPGYITTIQYRFAKSVLQKHIGIPIKVKIYDLLGRQVATLKDENQLMYVTWDGTNGNGYLVASGLYFYSVQLGEATDHGKIIFIR